MSILKASHVQIEARTRNNFLVHLEHKLNEVYENPSGKTRVGAVPTAKIGGIPYIYKNMEYKASAEEKGIRLLTGETGDLAGILIKKYAINEFTPDTINKAVLNNISLPAPTNTQDKENAINIINMLCRDIEPYFQELQSGAVTHEVLNLFDKSKIRTANDLKSAAIEKLFSYGLWVYNLLQNFKSKTLNKNYERTFPVNTEITPKSPLTSRIDMLMKQFSGFNAIINLYKAAARFFSKDVSSKIDMIYNEYRNNLKTVQLGYKNVAAAEQQMKASPQNPTFKTQYETILQSYRKEISELQTGALDKINTIFEALSKSEDIKPEKKIKSKKISNDELFDNLDFDSNESYRDATSHAGMATPTQIAKARGDLRSYPGREKSTLAKVFNPEGEPVGGGDEYERAQIGEFSTDSKVYDSKIQYQIIFGPGKRIPIPAAKKKEADDPFAAIGGGTTKEKPVEQRCQICATDPYVRKETTLHDSNGCLICNKITGYLVTFDLKNEGFQASSAYDALMNKDLEGTGVLPGTNAAQIIIPVAEPNSVQARKRAIASIRIISSSMSVPVKSVVPYYKNESKKLNFGMAGNDIISSVPVAGKGLRPKPIKKKEDQEPVEPLPAADLQFYNDDERAQLDRRPPAPPKTTKRNFPTIEGIEDFGAYIS